MKSLASRLLAKFGFSTQLVLGNRGNMFEWYVLFEAGQQLRLDVVSGVLRFLFYSSTMITYASAK